MEQIDFSFLSESQIKDIVERDYKELQELASKNSTKSIIIMSGGILEALLIDVLVFSKELDFEEVCKGETHNGNRLNLFTFIKIAKDKKIIREDVLSNAVRNYRNLVHAGKEIRENIHFDSADADLALSAIQIVLRDIKKWYEKERFLWKLEDDILNTSQEQKDFLVLFGSPSPTTPNQPEHPLITRGTYGSLWKLTESKILTKEQNERSKKLTYHLMPDAINFIEKHIINGKVQRTAITIDDKNVELLQWLPMGLPSSK